MRQGSIDLLMNEAKGFAEELAFYLAVEDMEPGVIKALKTMRGKCVRFQEYLENVKPTDGGAS